MSIAGIELPSEYQGMLFLVSIKIRLKENFYLHLATGLMRTVTGLEPVRNEKYKYIRNYFPENSHALDVDYRKQMLLMRHLTTLSLTGKLSVEQNNWFRTPKLMEELYDLENDPFELKNLSENPEYDSIKAALSKELDTWIENIDDLGRIPELELYKLIGK